MSSHMMKRRSALTDTWLRGHAGSPKRISTSVPSDPPSHLDEAARRILQFVAEHMADEPPVRKQQSFFSMDFSLLLAEIVGQRQRRERSLS